MLVVGGVLIAPLMPIEFVTRPARSSSRWLREIPPE
jgi:hypothetical protein